MDNKRELTNELIAASLKELMVTVPFEKITIRMITERAGIIRPTFYYHFQDKYETLEWIVRNQLLSGMDMLLERGMFDDAIKIFFGRAAEEKSFYRKAFAIIGQNSFGAIMVNALDDLFVRCVVDKDGPAKIGEPPLARRIASSYYSMNIVSFVKLWLSQQPDADAQEVAQACIYLLNHTYHDFCNR